MRKYILMLMAMFLVIGMAGAANYMYEKSSIKGVGMLEQVSCIDPTWIRWSEARGESCWVRPGGCPGGRT